MGRPKALYPFPTQVTTPGKISFLEHLLGIARHPKVGAVRVVLGANAELIRQAVEMDAASVVLNDDWPKGQLTSIQAAIRNLPAGATDGMMVFLVDHPLISAGLVDKLIERFYRTGAPVVVPTYEGKRGHPAIFASRLYDELLAAPVETGARAVVWAHAAEVIEMPTDEKGVILNLNSPGDIRRALSQDI